MSLRQAAAPRHFLQLVCFAQLSPLADIAVAISHYPPDAEVRIVNWAASELPIDHLATDAIEEHVLLLQHNIVRSVPEILLDARGEAAAQVAKGEEAAQQLLADLEATVADPVPSQNAADIVGTSMNSAQDLNVLMSALVTNGVICVCAGLAFGYLIHFFPLIYQHRLLSGEVDAELPKTTLGWATASARVSFNEVKSTSGLDQALILHFMHLCMWICAILGLPLIVVMCPLHAIWGSGATDNLSMIGFSNVAIGSWLNYVHAVLVWFVTAITMRYVHEAQQNFLSQRFDWLQKMAAPQVTTVLVEGIPAEYCTDAALRQYFSKMFTKEAVVEAYVVRKTASLVALIQALQATHRQLKQANYKWEQAGRLEDQRPGFVDLLGKKQDTIAWYEGKIKQLQVNIDEERQRMDTAALKYDKEILAPTGFVTFTSARDATLAQQVKYKENEEEFVTSLPPAPSDVLWKDLQVEPSVQRSYTTCGISLVALLFITFLPIVVSISAITDLHNLQQIGFINDLCDRSPLLANFLDGFLGSFALNFMMDLLPTILMFISKSFFNMKSEAWSQHQLQISTFWFNLIFVVLVTAVGNSLVNTISAVVQSPFSIFSLLGGSLPQASHFYLNYLILQWSTHMIGLLRKSNLIHFIIYRGLYGPEEAKALSEPEDQDGHGIGSRATKFTTSMVVVLVFCSLEPVICFLGFVNFALCRLGYGYLIVFAETRKADLGGVFWVAQLRQIMYGLLVYNLLMLGVLFQRGGPAPCALAIPSLLIWMRSYNRFQKELHWESLPFEEVVLKDSGASAAPEKDAPPFVESYWQPELRSSVVAPAPPATQPPQSPAKPVHLPTSSPACTQWIGSRLPCGGSTSANPQGSSRS